MFDLLGNALSQGFGAALTVIAKLLYAYIGVVLQTIGTWWLEVTPLDSEPNNATFAVRRITQPLAAALGTAGLIIGFVRVGRSAGSKEDTSLIIEGLMRVAIAGSVSIPGTLLLMEFSSKFSPWAYDMIIAVTIKENQDLMGLLPPAAEVSAVGIIGLGIMTVGPLMLLASVFQVMMVMGVEIAAALLSAILPVTAAGSTTTKGNQAFWKQVGWIFSCVMFKPAAAIIYGFGTALALGGGFGSADNPFLSMVAGLMTILLASFSLPALISLVAPTASVLGSSGGRFMSAMGGAAVGAAITMAAGLATGGAGAVGAAGAGAAGSAGGAASGAAAGGAAGGASSGAGAAGGASAAGASTSATEASSTASGASSSGNGSSAGSSSSGGSSGSFSASGMPHSSSSSDSSDSSGPDSGAQVSESAADTDASSSSASGAAGASQAEADSPSAAPGALADSPAASTADAGTGASGAETSADSSSASSSAAQGSAPATGAAQTSTSSSSESGSGAGVSDAASTGATGSSANSGSGASSTQASGTSNTSRSSGVSTSSSSSSSPATGAPATSQPSTAQGANNSPTTTNSTYRPAGGGYAAQTAARFLQDMTRAAGDEIEGAIRPEGAGQ